MGYRIARPADFPDVATLVERLNRNPTCHCIQSGTGEGADALLAEMLDLAQRGELLWALAMDRETPTGALGREFETVARRG